MPKIEQYTRQIMPSGFQNINVPRGAFGGFDLSGVSQALDNVAARMQEVKSRREKAEYINKVTAFQLENIQRSKELAQSDFDEDAFDVYSKDYNERATEFRSSIPESMMDQWAMDSTKMFADYAEAGIVEQARRVGVKAEVDRKNFLDTSGNIAYDNPDMIDDLLARVDEFSSTLPGSSSDRDLVAQDMKDTIRRKAADGMATQSPHKFIKEYKAGRFSDTPNASQFYEIAQREVQRQDRAAQAAQEKLVRQIQEGYSVSPSGGRRDPAKSALLEMQTNGVDVTENAGVLGFNAALLDQIAQTQRDRGLVGDDITLLPRDTSLAIANRINSITDIDEFDEYYNQLLSGTPPEYRGQVISEIMSNEFLTSDLRVYAQTDPEKHSVVRQAIFEMRDKEKKAELDKFLKESYDSSKITSLNERLNKDFNSYTKAMSTGIGGLELAADLRSVSSDLAKWHYSRNGNEKAAVEFSTSWLTDSVDVVDAGDAGAFLLGKEYNLDSDEIEQKSRIMKRQVVKFMRNTMNVDFPSQYYLTDATKQKYIDEIDEHGQWVNNDDNSGVVLTLYGSEVFRADGAKVEFPFGVINAVTDERPNNADEYYPGLYQMRRK